MFTAISFDKHLFHEVQWKSHLFPGSQVHCQELQDTDQQSCIVLCCSTYIYSGEHCQDWQRGSKSIGLQGCSSSMICSAATN